MAFFDGHNSYLLYHRPTKEGKYQLAIRITKDRKSSYVFTGKVIDKKHWDKEHRRVRKSHPNSSRLNAYLVKELARVNQSCLGVELDETEQSAQHLHKTVITKEQGRAFFAEAQKYLDNLRTEGKYNRYVSDKARIGRLTNFLKNDEITFEQVSVGKLHQFKAWLKGKHRTSERTAINYLVVIRTIYNQAIASGLVDRKHYPFGKGKIQIKFPPSEKIGLTKQEMRTLIEADLQDQPKPEHVRNIWLTAFFLAGMRASDVFRLTWDNIRDGRLHYTMGKNRKPGSLKLPEQVEMIFAHYLSDKRSEDDYIFPELKVVTDRSDAYLVQRKISYAIKNTNKYLKKLAARLGMEKPMTLHIARHTFAGLSADKIPIQLLQKLYRHADITTTINYQQSFSHRDLDGALSSIILDL